MCSHSPRMFLLDATMHDNHVQEGAAAFVEEFEAKESKYARTLEQLPTEGKKIPSDPKMWKCMETGVTENLWMNLSTGFIGSGRQHWDGSGGNGASERHFEAMGKKWVGHPLVWCPAWLWAGCVCVCVCVQPTHPTRTHTRTPTHTHKHTRILPRHYTMLRCVILAHVHTHSTRTHTHTHTLTPQVPTGG